MEQVQELTECSICCEVFVDPRILPCVHTFCLQCLTKTSLSSNLKPRDQMPCPLCREKFIIPKEGMGALRKNFFLKKLSEVAKVSNPCQKPSVCDICQGTDASKINMATQYCIQCHKNLCDLCCQDHKRFPEIKNHDICPLGSPVKEDLIKKFAKQYCDEHKRKEVEMYCFDCNRLICMICHAEKHMHHKCLGVEKAAATFCQEINKAIPLMNDYSKECSNKIQAIVKERKEHRDEVEIVMKAIRSRASELKEIVDKCANSLMDQLKSLNVQRTNELDIVTGNLDIHIATATSFVSYCNELQSKGSLAEICRNIDDFRTVLEHISRNHSLQSNQTFARDSIFFEDSNVEDFMKTKNVVGDIKVRPKATSGARDKVVLRSIGKLKISSVFLTCGVQVTKLEDKIYILSGNFIEIFEDLSPFKCIKSIRIKEITTPRDMVSSSESKCLYITDEFEQCVWKMTTDDHEITRWVNFIDSPFSISVVLDNQIMILKRSKPNNKLDFYRSDRSLAKSISLPTYIEQPRYSIQNPNGEFIICHKNASSKRWIISRLTSDGQTVICQFHPRVKDEDLKDPKCLALDLENNRLLVTEYPSKVLLFDSDSLRLKQILLFDGNDYTYVYGINGIFCDSKKNELLLLALSYIHIFTMECG